MGSPARELITVEDLRKSFGHAEALRGISFSVPESALVVIIGPSGCGKSTLLRCLNGLDGTMPRDLRHRLRLLREEVGMVFQSFNLFPHLTVLENAAKAPSPAWGDAVGPQACGDGPPQRRFSGLRNRFSERIGSCRIAAR